MPAMNFLFCGLHFYVFILSVLITLSAWQARLRWVGLTTTGLALIVALVPLVNPGWIASLQLPLKLAIFAGSLLITTLTKRTDTRHIGFLLILAAGGAVAAHLVSF